MGFGYAKCICCDAEVGRIPGGEREREKSLASEKSLENVQEMGQAVSDIRLFVVWWENVTQPS
jgi:hypothetical protein